MKKTLKTFAVVSAMSIMAAAIAGCGSRNATQSGVSQIDTPLITDTANPVYKDDSDMTTTVKDSTSADHGITIELIQKMVAWDKHRRILKDWQWNVMNEIISGKKTLNDRLAWGCKQNLKTLKQHGFTEE